MARAKRSLVSGERRSWEAAVRAQGWTRAQRSRQGQGGIQHQLSGTGRFIIHTEIKCPQTLDLARELWNGRLYSLLISY